jgi:hypothetical protein
MTIDTAADHVVIGPVARHSRDDSRLYIRGRDSVGGTAGFGSADMR